MYDYYVTPDYIAAAKGGFVKIEFDEWDTFSNTSSAGTKAYPVYSNGKIWISKAYRRSIYRVRKNSAQMMERA
ncbi:MAG: hypothetical protein V8R14_07115 [Clostridia bacterium]